MFEHVMNIVNRHRKAKISKENNLEVWREKKEDLQERIDHDDVKQGISKFLSSFLSESVCHKAELELEQD